MAVYLAEGSASGDAEAVGITFVVVGGLLLVIRRLAGNWIVDTLASGESIRDSASNAWFIGTDLLAGIAWTAIAYGAIVILAAWLAGTFASRRFGAAAVGAEASAIGPVSSTRSSAGCTCSSSRGARRLPFGSRGRSSSSPP